LFVSVAPPLRLNPSALPDDTVPELPMVPAPPLPSIPSFPAPVEVTAPVLVIVTGLAAGKVSVTGPVWLLLIVVGIYLTLFDPSSSLKAHRLKPQAR
jgi:hypothetical protein